MYDANASERTEISSPIPFLNGGAQADLQEMAGKLNPLVKFWDPLGLVDAGYWGFSQEGTIGWLRQSEIKHSRVAMAAFVGYCVQSNFVFPWSLTTSGIAHPSVDLSPPEQWDALPFASKVQIILFIGFLEWYSELYGNGEPHYTKGKLLRSDYDCV